MNKDKARRPGCGGAALKLNQDSVGLGNERAGL